MYIFRTIIDQDDNNMKLGLITYYLQAACVRRSVLGIGNGRRNILTLH